MVFCVQSMIESNSTQIGKLDFLKPRTHRLIIIILFVAAFGIRIFHINEPPLKFHPTRQYRSAIIARGYFFETQQSIPDWERNVATTNKDAESILEPPIMELLALLGYRIAGGEYLWIPRMLSVLIWLGGGVFLYNLAQDLISRDGAIFSTAFYLFLPYGISVSRSFQPDPLMVFLFLASIFAISRYNLQPSRTRLIIAALFSASAIIVRPICLFVIFSVFILASISRQGTRKTITDINLVLFGILSLLPATIFYINGIFFAGFLRSQAKGSFILNLFFSSAFWKGWLNQIKSVVGYDALVVALLGVFLFRRGIPKALLMGLWIGYVLFGLIFNYHIHTHDYYQVQFIPIIALSIAPIGVHIAGILVKSITHWHWRLALMGVLLFASFLYIKDMRWRLGSQDLRQVSIAQEIGLVTQHSTQTLFMTFAYGKPLKYHGEISGHEWPHEGDLQKEKIESKQEFTAEERLELLITQFSPEYFIVTDFKEFESQQDLNQYLMRTFPIISQTNDYVIFDLRTKDN